MLRDVGQAASAAVQAERLSRSGIAPNQLMDLLTRVTVDEAEITASGEEGRSAESTFWFAYIVAFMVYFMVAFYGVTVMRSVLEEKMNRISEVMVSSVRSIDLMLGKILGVSAAAMVQVGIWAIFALIVTGGGAYLPNLLGLPTEILGSLSVPLPRLGLLLSFFLLGFLLYSSIYAAMGAAMTTEQEAQATQMLVLVPLFIPLLFVGPITNDPTGTLARVLSIVPFCAPIAMPMRLATVNVPALEILLSLGLLALGVVAVAWVGGRVYRIGILSTARRPSLAEVGKWLKGA
jgi:ABC-2 type transport system permease protein